MRRTRWADLLLIAAIVPLAVWAWQTVGERSRLEATLARYESRVGRLDVPDRGKIYLQAVPTGSPTEFAWRAFYPAATSISCRFDSELGLLGDLGFGLGGSGKEEFTTIHLRAKAGGGVEVWFSQVGVHPQSTIGDRAISELIRGRWDQLRVERAGVDGVLVVDPKVPLVLIRILLSPEMMAEAEASGSPLAGKLTTPEIFRITLNPPNNLPRPVILQPPPPPAGSIPAQPNPEPAP